VNANKLDILYNQCQLNKNRGFIVVVFCTAAAVVINKHICIYKVAPRLSDIFIAFNKTRNNERSKYRGIFSYFWNNRATHPRLFTPLFFVRSQLAVAQKSKENIERV
jgi:hypothetical protein